MEMILGTICVCLFIFSFVLTLKYMSLKRNLRNFSDELEKLKDSNYRQPLKVTDFDKDLVELAVKVNEHTDIQQKLGKEYEDGKKRLGTVISGISHDFRTPLTASLGYLQMMEKSGELSEKNSGYLDIAIQKNKYLKELSDEFFELTKIESGKEEIQLEEVNLSNILTETILEQHSWIAERNISADLDIEDGIVINADKRSITRILNNLMSNARKYAADRFGAVLKREDDRIVLRVYNGVEEDGAIDVDKVFEPFYRMDSRTATGSGLGLYVVKMLCDRADWTVDAEINEGVFSVEIGLG